MSVEDRYAYGQPDEPDLEPWYEEASENIRAMYRFGRGLWGRIEYRFEREIEIEAERLMAVARREAGEYRCYEATAD